MASHPWKTAAHAIVTALSGWIHREQEAIVAYQFWDTTSGDPYAMQASPIGK